MSARNNVVLTFSSHVGKQLRLTIPRADMTLNAARARATMEAMIDDGVVLTSAGFPHTIVGASLVSTTRVPLVSD